MQRVLEPELMDTQEDAVEYDAMDFLEADTRFADAAIALLGGPSEATVLDIGTGTAKIPVLVLERRGNLDVLGVDLAKEMLKVAERRVAAAGFSDRCKLACMDAKKLDLPGASFDLVMSNSIAHHIPDPGALFREIARVVKPNGAIVVRDLIRPATVEEAREIVERVAAGEHPHQKKLFFDSLCAALTLAEVEVMVKSAGLERMTIAKCSDRHWTAERARSFR